MVAEARPGVGMASTNKREKRKRSPRTPWGDSAIAKKAVMEKKSYDWGKLLFLSLSLLLGFKQM